MTFPVGLFVFDRAQVAVEPSESLPDEIIHGDDVIRFERWE